jgi:hypothetical protein
MASTAERISASGKGIEGTRLFLKTTAKERLNNCD